MNMKKGPLSDFRVLELGNLIAAPYAGRLFAEFGADVIKVERPRIGDELRQWRLFQGNTSLFWSLQARNKRSITLDLRTPEGQDIVLKLLPHVDVVLENFRPGTLEKWNLGYEAMKEVNPDIVFVRISGYGQSRSSDLEIAHPLSPSARGWSRSRYLYILLVLEYGCVLWLAACLLLPLSQVVSVDRRKA
jgi:crotonobetainyl-CoA:carnitine CoA-transferase CaiB-like acyl-CoA transferase